MEKLILATGNRGKLAELSALLGDLDGVVLLTPADVGLGNLAVAEDGADYAANATLKATAYCQAAGLPCLADDSGLEVEALGGAPGVHSARWAAGDDAARRKRLLEQLRGQPQPWAARFVSAVCLALPASPEPELHVASGACRGEIIPSERGAGGFGYDPIFMVEDTGWTMAELSFAEKNLLSHRARAVGALRARLQDLLA